MQISVVTLAWYSLHAATMFVTNDGLPSPLTEKTIIINSGDRHMSGSSGMKIAKLTLNPKGQNLEAVHKIVSGIIGRSGCLTCGRLINIDFQFQGDPEKSFETEGVIAVQTQGF
jgi:hypothetical protein